MKFAVLSLPLAVLIPTGHSYSIPSSQKFTYEATVEHSFIPWLSTDWSKEEITKSSNYNRKYTEASQAHSGGIGVEYEGVGVNTEFSTSWSDISEVESKVETFKSSKESQSIKYQDGVRLVLRTVNMRTCFNNDCHTKILKDVVSYINNGAITDAVRKYWKEESFRYLNAFLLPSSAKKLPVKDVGYARFNLAAKLTTWREVNTYWIAGKYGKQLHCPSNKILTGICGSGKNADCRDSDGKKVYAKIQCSDASMNPNSNCASWQGDNRKYGKLQECPYWAPFLSAYCGSGKNADCWGNYAAGQCCAKHGLTMNLSQCQPLQKGHWGQDLVCQSGYAVHKYCGSGQNPDCQGKWTNIVCCPFTA